MANNGQTPEDPSKTFVYLGPSLPLAKAREILPKATYRPPARQGDITSDLVNYNPTRLILIDGEFRNNLSVWHKELVYALQYPNVKGVYGASSMGALRAAELDYLGMVGIGEIYGWYRDGVTEDDAEVAVSYGEHRGKYHLRSVPLVDIRAGVQRLRDRMPDDPLSDYSQEFLDQAGKVHYTERTPELCQKLWDMPGQFPSFACKETDAVMALSSYWDYEVEAEINPEPDHLSLFFQALYERDRKILIGGIEVPQQHIEAHVLLHNPEYERICWDSSNQELALILCNCLAVTVTLSEIERENVRFQQRAGLATPDDFNRFLADNGWSLAEYERVMIQNSRIRKLQHALTVTKAYRRNTQSILDYLRTHQGFEYWAREAIKAEDRLAKIGVDDWLGIDPQMPVFTTLANHFDSEGLELKSSAEEYLLETGFSNVQELGIALARTNAGKEDG
jgi:hypothetical protein